MVNIKDIENKFKAMSLLEKIEWVNDQFYDRVYTFEFPLPCKDNVRYRKEINERIADYEEIMDRDIPRIAEEVCADYIYFDEVRIKFYEFNLDCASDSDKFDDVFLEDMIEWERQNLEYEQEEGTAQPF